MSLLMSPMGFKTPGRPLPKKRRPNQRSIDIQEETALKTSMTLLSASTRTDEFTIFGEYVANELGLLTTSPDIQFKLKYDIQNLILNASMEHAIRHNNRQATVVPSAPPSTTSRSSWDEGSQSNERKEDQHIT